MFIKLKQRIILSRKNIFENLVTFIIVYFDTSAWLEQSPIPKMIFQTRLSQRNQYYFNSKNFPLIWGYREILIAILLVIMHTEKLRSSQLN